MAGQYTPPPRQVNSGWRNEIRRYKQTFGKTLHRLKPAYLPAGSHTSKAKAAGIKASATQS